MNCKDARALLSAYLDDELEADVHQLLDDHLDSCPGCRAEKEELDAAVRLLRRFGRVGSVTVR